MVTTNQKSIINAQKIKRKESKHNTKDGHQTTREESKRRNRKELQKQPGALRELLKISRLNSGRTEG